jgi:hypothetical protein
MREPGEKIRHEQHYENSEERDREQQARSDKQDRYQEHPTRGVPAKDCKPFRDPAPAMRRIDDLDVHCLCHE